MDVAGAVVAEGKTRVGVAGTGEGAAEVGEGRPEGVGNTKGVIGNGVGRLKKLSEQPIMVRNTNPAARIRMGRFIFLSFQLSRRGDMIVSRGNKQAVSATEYCVNI
jgi:hypothetical protein